MQRLRRRTWCLLVAAGLTLPLGAAVAPVAHSLSATPRAAHGGLPVPHHPNQAVAPPALTPAPPPSHLRPDALTPPGGTVTTGTPVAYPTAGPQDAALLAAGTQATPRPALTPAHYPTADPQDAAVLAAGKPGTATPTATRTPSPTATRSPMPTPTPAPTATPH